MNTSNFDSEFCGSLPLHYINTIMPFGVVLIVAKEDLRIIQASENVQEYLNAPVKVVVQSALSDYYKDKDANSLRQKLEEGIKTKGPQGISFHYCEMNMLVHNHQDFYLVELEFKREPEGPQLNGLQDVRDLMTALEPATTVQQVCDAAVAELKRISQFDGIMMYRFDADWNGTVISENKSAGLEPYLGVTFPASDVPRQARQLYLRNPYRLIPDRTYSPAKLYPVINPLSKSFTDLSSCHLRGVADVHLEYLHNMKVMASMSLRVIHNDKLWGLISCNHTSAYPATFEQCSIFSLLSDVVSNKISSIINKEEYGFIAQLQKDRNQIMERIYQPISLEEVLFNQDISISNLFHATGAVLYTNGSKKVSGQVPEALFLDDLLLWIQAKEIEQVFATHNLVNIIEEAAKHSEIASGMLVIPFGTSATDFIVLFRPEVVKTIEWGGNPHQAINFEEDGKAYHPRNSFKVWMETVNQTSQPWHEQELQIAATVRSFLLEHQSKNKQHN
ncbi:GAF domain-containing protein [Desertivirga arenae]|uniref:GAF domain-containing protein n=1 Tax=Desertivirga arenae TaxID=2810309 RepID=UPI001A95EDF2|nr:GAF domain-containing protein [Pedobacter sp. SYSU D00823]